MKTLVIVLLLGLVIRGQGQGAECEESELGYQCKKTMTEYFDLHWSLGPTTDGADAEDGEIAIALVGDTFGWVGFSFAEVPGSMFPADAVVGWTEPGSEDFTILPYRVTEQNITSAEEDPGVTLTSLEAEEVDDVTTIRFVRSLSDGTVPISTDEAIPVNVAVGFADGLEYHGFEWRSSDTVQLNLAVGGVIAGPTAPPSEAPPSEVPTGEGDLCVPSDLGYSCVVVGDNLVQIHWTLGPAEAVGDVPEVAENEIAFALVAETEGWVGVSFAEEAGMMAPADAILGWVEGDVATVTPYRVEINDISADNESQDIAIRETGGSEVDGTTIISFVVDTTTLTNPVDLALAMMNFARGDADALEYHGFTNRGSLEINLESTPSEDASLPPMEEEVAGETAEAAGGGSGGCAASDIGYGCLLNAANTVFIHWTVGPAPANGDAPEVVDGELAIALVSETTGWVAMSFAEGAAMSPADAIIGWVDGDTPTILPYRITERDVSSSDESTSIVIKNTAGSEVDGTTTIQFVVELDTLTNNPVNLDSDLNVNWAKGSTDGLAYHDSDRGLLLLNFVSGGSGTVSLDLKYYKAHGSCMIIAWIGLAPLGVLIARNKHLLEGLGEGVWFQIHRVIQVLALCFMIAGAIIAFAEFEDAESDEGKRHRKIGISIIVVGLVQGFIPFLRPHPGTPYRYLFNYVHWWLGRSAVVMGIATVFLGINAFDLFEEDNVDKWWITCVIILSVYFLFAAIGELTIAHKRNEEAAMAHKKEEMPRGTEMTTASSRNM